jgi:hypothetical protein
MSSIAQSVIYIFTSSKPYPQEQICHHTSSPSIYYHHPLSQPLHNATNMLPEHFWGLTLVTTFLTLILHQVLDFHTMRILQMCDHIYLYRSIIRSRPLITTVSSNWRTEGNLQYQETPLVSRTRPVSLSCEEGLGGIGRDEAASSFCIGLWR